ncbi:MAG: ROK family protein [Candidatus Saganbacteria bacterium]|nr:ROK family protein [Candidatus Saganbacteria bacterium]
MSRPEQLIITGAFGGTHIRLAVMSNKGRIISKVDLPTKSFSSQDQLVTTLDVEMRKLEGGKDARFGGIGVPCPINEETGEPAVPHPANITKFGFQGFFSALSDRVGKRIFAYNDAQTDAMGEAMFGAGRRHQNVIFHGLGTGYGVGIVIGNIAIATEFGHAPAVNAGVDEAGDKRPCGCGSRWGCAEQYASGSAFPRSLASDWRTAEEVGKAFLAGNHNAETVVREAMNYLAYNIAIAKLITPGALHVIGGGVSLIGEPLMAVLREQLAALHNKALVAWPDIVPEVALSELPHDAGLLGAGVLAEQSAGI